MSSRIRNPVILSFDPTDKLEGRINEIFKDDIARTLWLTIRQSNAASQYFDTHCLEVSKYIKENGLPESPQQLRELLVMKFHNEGSFNLNYCEELLPYLNGKKIIAYEVRK